MLLMCFLGSPVSYHMASTLFLSLPTLLPEYYYTGFSPRLEFLKLPKPCIVLGGGREWPCPLFYINLLEEYKGLLHRITNILESSSWKQFFPFLFITLSSLIPRSEKGWVKNIAKCPFSVQPSYTKAFMQSQACLLDTSQS